MAVVIVYVATTKYHYNIVLGSLTLRNLRYSYLSKIKNKKETLNMHLYTRLLRFGLSNAYLIICLAHHASCTRSLRTTLLFKCDTSATKCISIIIMFLCVNNL